MPNVRELLAQIERGAFDRTLRTLYPRADTAQSRTRYAGALGAFLERFGNRENAVLVSAPGRTEIGGNHTDHQRGRVLAASVDLDVLCVAAPTDDRVAEVHSAGHAPERVDLSELAVQPSDRESAGGLIRGIAGWMDRAGHSIGGFAAYTTSEVLVGSGLSSSAAFEVAVGNILHALYPGEITPVEIAVAGRYAENHYFGKPSGLMDQTASSVGGFVAIDFADPDHPRIEPVAFDLGAAGLNLCIVNTGGSHANLTPDYAAIPAEMGAVAAFFGKQVLREVDPAAFLARLAALRAAAGDRAVLRALHFFEENDRVPQQAEALRAGDLRRFLELILRSGRSSMDRLQNIYSPAAPAEQGLSLALSLSERVLDGRGGAWRVHGGGFAGTVQAFVPHACLEEYRAALEAVFGPDSCHVLAIRPLGGVHLTPDPEAR